MAKSKALNRENLQAVAYYCGDGAFQEMFWDMFDMLSIPKQEEIIERAIRICKEKTGIEVKLPTR